jgi:LuxR family maltose regulon positive regulatory protein
MHVGLSEVVLERNELADAAKHLQISADLGEDAGLPQHAYRWRVATARLRHANGDIDSALDLLDEAERLYNTDFSPAVRPVAAMKARMNLARGDVDAARRWMTGRGLAADDEIHYVREFEHLTVARTLLAAGAIDDAVGLLDRLLDAAERGGRGGAVIEILILQAQAHHSRGNASAAAAAIDKALICAEPEGFVRVFVDAGPSIAALLRAITSHDQGGSHARRVLAAETARVSNAPRQHGLVEELSSRELDVLRLLRSDLSGPDIARELLVSLNTFRTHTKNIYAKLGVNNRRQAVRRASELGV